MPAPARKTPVKTPVLVPQPHGGALRVGNPGNKGGGRVKEYVEKRASEILTDPTVWDVQKARAKAGADKALDRAITLVLGKPKEHAEVTTALTIRIVRE